ncbi:MAG: hypothetical protein ACQEXC_14295 [Pseudomonadota bacterium]
MTPYALTLLLFGLLGGAGLATLATTPSHILGDRLLVAALGGGAGLLAAGAILAGWYGAAAAWSALGG